MQKLSVELKNAPTDASQVRCSANLALNRDQSLSVPDTVLADNNSDENRSQHRGSFGLRVQNIVYVLNMRGKPLMPTTQQKASKILKEKKARVISRSPFTIQLKYATGEAVQPIALGVDAGYREIGLSAITDTKELISCEVKLRNDVSKKLSERRMYRRQKRNKLWYREPRFDNRIRPKDWLSPSIQNKLDAHIRVIGKIKRLLPISNSNITIEVANFDTQKMQNPEISNIEYQQGELQGYEVREYLLEKWGRKCAYCGKTNVPLEIEHIVPISRGGSNRVSNLTIACHECNQKKGNMTAGEFGYPVMQKKALMPLKGAASPVAYFN